MNKKEQEEKEEESMYCLEEFRIQYEFTNFNFKKGKYHRKFLCLKDKKLFF